MFFGAAHTGGERHIWCFHADALGLPQPYSLLRLRCHNSPLGLRCPIPYGGSAALFAIVEAMTHWSLLRLAMPLKATQSYAPGPMLSRLWHPNTGLCKHPRDAAIRKPS